MNEGIHSSANINSFHVFGMQTGLHSDYFILHCIMEKLLVKSR